MNPAREVKTERFSRTEGKTPAFVDGEVQKLLDIIETSTHTSLRDRALLGVLRRGISLSQKEVKLEPHEHEKFSRRLRF